MLAHAEIYRRVCEARPECWVVAAHHPDGTAGTLYPTDGYPRSWWAGDRGNLIADETALALITDHWTAMLPEYASLSRSNDNPGPRWYVDAVCCDGLGYVGPCADSRFHALAEWLVPGSTEEET